MEVNYLSSIIKQYDKRVGITYAYESTSYWDKEKKQPRSRRRLIGIVDSITGEITPTTKRKKSTAFADEQNTVNDISWLHSNRTFYGATYLFDCIGKITGVADDLRFCFPAYYDQILSIAYYLILEDKNPLSRFPQWSRLHTHPYGKAITSQRSSELFSDISDAGRMNFFRLQGKRREENEYLAYDTTSVSSYSQSLRQVKHGKNKDHDKLPQINLAILYGEDSCLPFYYRKLAGNISDVSTIKQMLRDMDFLGCKRIKFVMDRGFYSEKNVTDFFIERLKFLMGTKLSIKYVRSELENVTGELRSWDNFLPQTAVYGVTAPIEWKFKRFRSHKKDEVAETRRAYLHFFYDTVKSIEDERDFNQLIHLLHDELVTGKREKSHETLYAKYFDEKTTPVRGYKVKMKQNALDSAKNEFGYFALIGNDAISANQALTTYRNKDVAEKAFDNVKDRLDMRRLNVSSDLSLEGKLFVVFIALIFIAYIHKAMIDARLYSKYTMHELLDELEMIERFERQGHKPQLGEITTKQFEIFEALKIDSPKT